MLRMVGSDKPPQNLRYQTCVDSISNHFEDNFEACIMNNALKIGTAIEDVHVRL